MTFPEKLKNLRKEKGITQEELASAIFVSRTLISKYENGSVYPTKENAEKIAIYFNIDLSELIDKNDTIGLVLRHSDLNNKINIALTVFTAWIFSIYFILMFIPFVKIGYWDYSNGVPPTVGYNYFSPIAITLDVNNPILIITAITLAANTILGVLSIKFKNNLWIKLSNYILFIINLLLLLFSIAFIISAYGSFGPYDY